MLLLEKLHRLTIPSRQACSIKVDSTGLEVRCEEESKTLQSLVFFKAEV